MSKAVDFKTRFQKDMVPELKKTLGIKNNMAIPKVTKVTVNIGIGTYTKKSKDYSSIVNSVAMITGQKPVLNKAKKAISNFKVREGEVIGIAVTIRGAKMYDFLNKLVNIVFPRVRDFRGISEKAFDGKGNYSIGFKEHTVFPEISPDEAMNVHGLQVNICTTATSNEAGYELLKIMGFPFKNITK